MPSSLVSAKELVALMLLIGISYIMHRHILWHGDTGLCIVVLSPYKEIDWDEVLDILIARVVVNA